MFTKDSRILNRMLKTPLTSMSNAVGAIFKTYSHPYGDWILNQGYEIIGNNIKYTAYKTNNLNYYDSFALTNLVQALVKSFHDPDLQQYAAFTTAVEQLLGSVDWVLDPANNQIKYYEEDPNNLPQCWVLDDGSGCYATAQAAANASCAKFNLGEATIYQTGTDYAYATCSGGGYATVLLGDNPNYDPDAEPDEKYLPLDTVAQKVISNAESSEDEVLKMLSEDYIDLVTNSVFDTNPSKQFVKLEDLTPQLEANKVLR